MPTPACRRTPISANFVDLRQLQDIKDCSLSSAVIPAKAGIHSCGRNSSAFLCASVSSVSDAASRQRPSVAMQAYSRGFFEHRAHRGTENTEKTMEHAGRQRCVDASHHRLRHRSSSHAGFIPVIPANRCPVLDTGGRDPLAATRGVDWHHIVGKGWMPAPCRARGGACAGMTAVRCWPGSSAVFAPTNAPPCPKLALMGLRRDDGTSGQEHSRCAPLRSSRVARSGSKP